MIQPPAQLWGGCSFLKWADRDRLLWGSYNYGHCVASSPSTEARKLPRSLTCGPLVSPRSYSWRATFPSPVRGSLWLDTCWPTSWYVDARCDVTVPQQLGLVGLPSAKAGTTVTATKSNVNTKLIIRLACLFLNIDMVILLKCCVAYGSERSMSQCAARLHI